MGRAALMFVAFAAPLHAAPVPPPPPLTEAALIGTWRLEWVAYDGDAVFRADGSFEYAAKDLSWHFAGRWWVERGRLVIWERTVNSPSSWDVRKYEIALTTGRPVLRGTVYETGRPTHTFVTLTPKERDP